MRQSLTLGLIVAAIFLGITRGHAQVESSLIKLDPALDDIVSANTKVEKLADGFHYVEGPVWVRQGGYLLFSDIPANVIDRWTPNGKVSVFLEPSGFTGKDASGVGMELTVGSAVVTLIGSNGITLDRQGRVVYCAHGDRAIIRLEKDNKRTVLADRFEGKRLNSPNDLVYKSNGTLYFTDPPAGLRGNNESPQKELPFHGVYLLKAQKLQLLDKDFTRPNGLALSPDEKYLYVADSTKRLIMRFEVKPDDTIANGQVFIDMTPDKAPGNPDGMKVDKDGNVYSSGPGGVWIISPGGKHLGTIVAPESPTNLAFGDADGKTLYLTARTGLYRIRLNKRGVQP